MRYGQKLVVDRNEDAAALHCIAGRLHWQELETGEGFDIANDLNAKLCKFGIEVSIDLSAVFQYQYLHLSVRSRFASKGRLFCANRTSLPLQRYEYNLEFMLSMS